MLPFHASDIFRSEIYKVHCVTRRLAESCIHGRSIACHLEIWSEVALVTKFPWLYCLLFNQQKKGRRNKCRPKSSQSRSICCFSGAFNNCNVHSTEINCINKTPTLIHLFRYQAGETYSLYALIF